MKDREGRSKKAKTDMAKSAFLTLKKLCYLLVYRDILVYNCNASFR
jgi:hypothetical protein